MDERGRLMNTRSFEIALALAIVLAHLYVVFAPANSLVNWFTTDDAFYYFKVAQNISEGHGSTFDQIGYTNGYHPLWLLVCIPIFSLARYDLILPLRLVVLLMSILTAGTSVLLFRLISLRLSALTAGLAAIFWAFFPTSHAVTTTLGMESGINAFFIMLLLYQTAQFDAIPERRTRRQLWVIGVTALLMVLSRLDNAFLAVFIGLWLLFPHKRVRALIFADFLFIFVAVFGSFLLRLPIANYMTYSGTAMAMLMIALVIKPVVYYAFGLYRADRGGLKAALRQIIAAALASLGVSVTVLLAVAAGLLDGLPRSVIVLDMLLSIMFVLVTRRLIRTPVPDDSMAGSPLEAFSRQRWLAWLPKALAFFAPLGVGMLAYLAINWQLFGTATPVSGQIKRWWGSMYTVYGRLPRTHAELFGLQFDSNLSPFYLFSAIPLQLAQWYAGFRKIMDDALIDHLGLTYFWLFSATILLIVVLRWRTLREKLAGWAILPLLVACLVQAANYKLGYYAAMHTWYWIAEFILITILLAAVLDSAAELLTWSRPLKSVLAVGAMAVTLGLVVSFAAMLSERVPWQVDPENAEDYRLGPKLLTEVTEPGSLIGCTGGGVVSYFMEGRTVVNLDGLISSYPYFQRVHSGDMRGYLNEIGLNYVYGANYVLTYSEPYKDVFPGQTEYLTTLVGSDLYRYYPAGYP